MPRADLADRNPYLDQFQFAQESDGSKGIKVGPGYWNDLPYIGNTGIKVYRAILTQSASFDPEVVVFENTLGGPVEWTRSGAGIYLGTVNGAPVDIFPLDKTVVMFNAGTGDIGNLMCAARRVNGNSIQIQTQEQQLDVPGETINPVNVDGCLDESALEILVYP